MAQIIGLPKLSPTMEEGVLVKWVKKEGDAVEPGDLVAEVETDKANMDFNLEDEGVLLKLLVEEGATVKLGAPVAILGEAGEDISDLVAQAQAGGDGAAPPSPAPAAVESKESAKEPAKDEQAAKPAAQPAPSGQAAPAAKPSQGRAAPSGGRLLASPLAKNLAIELGIDLRSVSGTGPGGRIVERDVRAAAEGGGARAEAPAEPAQGPGTALAVVEPDRSPASIPVEGDHEDVPLSRMRKTIAKRLLEAKQSIPHFYLTRSFDTDPLMSFRKRLNALLGDRGKVSVNDLILKGTALALRRVPQCNAAFLGDAIRYYSRVHLGVAVAIDEGLVTPVIRDADLKGIGVIAAEVRDLASRAKERRLKMHEIQGSTFTVSNLGMFGIDQFSAIINPPEAGILAVGTILEQPTIRNGELAVSRRMNLVLSCDHRVIDGALGARFLAELADLLEQPESLAL